MEPNNHSDSVPDPERFDPYMDAETIVRAIKGINKDLDVVSNLLVKRTLNQRQEIRRAFKTRYGKDLLTSFGDELYGDYESLVKNLFRTPIEILANDICRELKKVGRSSDELTAILCCCNNTEIYLLKNAYAASAHHRSLETDIRKGTKGAYCQLLEEILKSGRYEESLEELSEAQREGNIYRIVDRTLVDKDVKDLHLAINEKGFKADPKVLISILTKRSKVHIKAIWSVYIETDLSQLKADYAAYFGEHLVKHVQSDTSFDYRKLLELLLNP
ncbi:unnamed protein product [Echinostoma caproni]|uniref:Annexin n=1 Tax=Echinostoma caproni TaxID=27848 RepID=A0A183A894_9TREM|nr:unnamed protein product [Echinostoma caproni]